MKFHLWNMFANIKNAQNAKKLFVLEKKQKKIISVLNILWEENFILGYKILNKENQILKIFVNYKKNNKTVIKKINFISKPSKKIYYKCKQIWKIKINLGLFIFSTNKGIMSINKCKKKNIGGELICIIK